MKHLLKRINLVFLAVLAGAVGLAALAFRRKQSSPLAPPAPRLEDVAIPIVNEKPVENYETEKIKPSTDAKAVVVSINGRHK
jgi:hypothetical protein